MRRTRKQYNSKICALFLMQYTLLIPLMSYIPPRLLVAICGVLLICGLVIKNGTCVNKNVCLFYYLFILIILLKIAISDSDLSTIGWIFVYTAPPVFVMAYGIDCEAFIRYCIKLSKLAFFFICWLPFTSAYEYMRFGYGMVPVVIFCYLDVVYYLPKKDKKQLVFDIAVMILGSVEILIYGARGSLLTIILFLLLERFVVGRAFSAKNIILLALGLLTWWKIVPILDYFEKISKRIGIYSYAITKFKMQITRGLAYASSGRDRLFEQAIEKIKEHPLLGNEIVLDESGGRYVHNLFLQVGVDMGIIFAAALTIFLIYVLCKIGSKKTAMDARIALCAFFSISVGRLLISSTIWRRPEFWMLISLCLTVESNKIGSIEPLCKVQTETIKKEEDIKAFEIIKS